MQQAPDVDACFVALTRPPMALGVTYTYFFFNFMLSSIAFVALSPTHKNFLVILFFGLMHGIGYMLCLHEPFIFDILATKLNRTMKGRNRRFWGATSYRP
jgi:type IV secretion system protein VirB3